MAEDFRRKIAIVGLGRVGSVLARLISESPHQFLGGFSSHPSRAKEALNRIGTGKLLEPDELKEADLVILSVPDRKIKEVANVLSSRSLPYENMTFVHCSGSLRKDILGPLEEEGANVGVFHPLFPFIEFSFSLENIKRAYVAVEGPEWLFDFARDLGFSPFPAPPKRELYHLGAVYSSGLLLALLSFPIEIADELKVPREAYLKLAETALKGSFKFGLSESITGPWKRGDEEVIKKHLEVCRDPDLYLRLLERIRKILGKD